MLQGQFNLSVTQVPFGMSNISLTTTLVSALLGDPSYSTACPSCSVTLVLKPSAAAVARGPLGGETGTVILTVPNYHLDAVADQSGVPLALISANVTFNLPVTLNVSSAQIAPWVGAIDLTDVRVTDDPIGADPTKFATGVTTLFPLAARLVGRGRRLELQRRLRGDLPEPAVSRAGGATRATSWRGRSRGRCHPLRYFASG